jgi:hypothetical protein
VANAPRGTQVGDVVYFARGLSPGFNAEPNRGYRVATVLAVSDSGNVAVRLKQTGTGTGRQAPRVVPDYQWGEPFFATLEDCRAHYVAKNEREVAYATQTLTRAEDRLRECMNLGIVSDAAPAEVPA